MIVLDTQNKKKKRKNWDDIIETVATLSLQTFNDQGCSHPQIVILRSSLKTKAIESLSRAITETRKNSSVPADCLIDQSRHDWEWFNNDDVEFAESLLMELKNGPANYKALIPRWLGQQHYVEVWLQKEAMAGPS